MIPEGEAVPHILGDDRAVTAHHIALSMKSHSADHEPRSLQGRLLEQGLRACKAVKLLLIGPAQMHLASDFSTSVSQKLPLQFGVNSRGA
jgi:hypothetical protein